MTRALGYCRQYVDGRDECGGRLIVDRTVNGIEEAVCDRCGNVAGHPLSRTERGDRMSPRPDNPEEEPF